MIVGWKKGEILDLKDKYNMLYRLAKTQDEKRKYLLTLASIDAILNYYQGLVRGEKKQKENPDIINKDDLFFLQDYQEYIPYIRTFADFSDPIDYEDPTKGKIDTHAIGMINEIKSFYSSVGGIYESSFSELIKGGRLRIKFVDGQERATGATFPILNTNIIYMVVGRVQGFQDYLTTTHECAHGISFLMNPDAKCSYDRFLFQELMPILFETLICDDKADSLNSLEEAKAIKINHFNDYLYSAKMVCSKIDMLESLNSKHLRNEKAMREFLINYHHLTNKDIDILLSEGIPNISVYVVSYLTAVELYLLYKEDKESALNILKEMVLAKESIPSDYLSLVKKLGIEPGANIATYRKLLHDSKALKKNT